MHRTGKQPNRQDQLILDEIIPPMDSDPPPGDQENDEDSADGTRDVVTGTPAFLEVANEEKGPREVAPADVIETVEVEPRTKTERPSKE
ncbi:MAG: hypothetical protein ABL931_10350 [Usitatibacteraceae bacterium]